MQSLLRVRRNRDEDIILKRFGVVVSVCCYLYHYIIVIYLTSMSADYRNHDKSKNLLFFCNDTLAKMTSKYETFYQISCSITLGMATANCDNDAKMGRRY